MHRYQVAVVVFALLGVVSAISLRERLTVLMNDPGCQTTQCQQVLSAAQVPKLNGNLVVPKYTARITFEDGPLEKMNTVHGKVNNVIIEEDDNDNNNNNSSSCACANQDDEVRNGTECDCAKEKQDLEEELKEEKEKEERLEEQVNGVSHYNASHDPEEEEMKKEAEEGHHQECDCEKEEDENRAECDCQRTKLQRELSEAKARLEELRNVLGEHNSTSSDEKCSCSSSNDDSVSADEVVIKSDEEQQSTCECAKDRLRKELERVRLHNEQLQRELDDYSTRKDDADNEENEKDAHDKDESKEEVENAVESAVSGSSSSSSSSYSSVISSSDESITKSVLKAVTSAEVISSTDVLELLGNVTAKLHEIDEDIAAANIDRTETKSDVTAAERLVEAAEEAYRKQNNSDTDEVADMKKEVKELEVRLEKDDSSADDIKKRIEELEERIEKVENRLNVRVNQTTSAAPVTKVAELARRLSVLEDKLEGNTEDRDQSDEALVTQAADRKQVAEEEQRSANDSVRAKAQEYKQLEAEAEVKVQKAVESAKNGDKETAKAEAKEAEIKLAEASEKKAEEEVAEEKVAKAEAEKETAKTTQSLADAIRDARLNASENGNSTEVQDEKRRLAEAEADLESRLAAQRVLEANREEKKAEVDHVKKSYDEMIDNKAKAEIDNEAEDKHWESAALKSREAEKHKEKIKQKLIDAGLSPQQAEEEAEQKVENATRSVAGETDPKHNGTKSGEGDPEESEPLKPRDDVELAKAGAQALFSALKNRK